MQLASPIPHGALPSRRKRGWTYSTKQDVPRVYTKLNAKTPGTHKGRKNIPPLWAYRTAALSRQFQAIIMGWWRDGLEPNGPAWWEALAAANPVTNYRGQTVTLTGQQWFCWYQANALHFSGFELTSGIFPGPAWPIAPTIPWITPPAPLLTDWYAGTLHDLQVRMTLPLWPNDRNIATWWQWHPPTLPTGQPAPRYRALTTYVFGNVTDTWIYVCFPQVIRWPTPGTHGRIFVALDDAITRNYSPQASIDFFA
jgi:hypothetical protein